MKNCACCRHKNEKNIIFLARFACSDEEEEEEEGIRRKKTTGKRNRGKKRRAREDEFNIIRDFTRRRTRTNVHKTSGKVLGGGGEKKKIEERKTVKKRE